MDLTYLKQRELAKGNILLVKPVYKYNGKENVVVYQDDRLAFVRKCIGRFVHKITKDLRAILNHDHSPNQPKNCLLFLSHI